MFFLGQFQHTIDEKGRLTIPARFRDVLSEQGGYVMQGFDHNLLVLTTATFDYVSRQVNAMNMTDPSARLLRRMVFATASKLEVDKAGRILIPQFLRQAAGLNGEAVVVGSGEFFEIWSPDLWNNQINELQDSEANVQRFQSLMLSAGN